MNLHDLIPNYNLLTIRPVGDGTVKLFFKIKAHFSLLSKRTIEMGMYRTKVNYIICDYITAVILSAH